MCCEIYDAAAGMGYIHSAERSCGLDRANDPPPHTHAHARTHARICAISLLSPPPLIPTVLNQGCDITVVKQVGALARGDLQEG